VAAIPRHRRPVRRQAPRTRAPDLLWLAVYALPYTRALPPKTVTMLGDLERCLAWALIESE